MNLITKLSTALLMLVLVTACVQEEEESEIETSSGEAGSTARFTIQNGHLITVEEEYVKLFDLADPATPKAGKQYLFSWFQDIETIYPYKTNQLLIGSNRGVYIYDHSTPGTLEELSYSEHRENCDPVVALNDFMYVTVRSVRNCGSNTSDVNRLLTYDISNPEYPVETNRITMIDPYGLAASDGKLFVCAGDGLYQFDLTDPAKPDYENKYSLVCNDLIATTDPMIITTDTGIALAERSESGLTILSEIEKGM